MQPLKGKTNMHKGAERKEKTIQIRGAETDKLIVSVEAYAKKLGVQVATAARLLIRLGLEKTKVTP